MSMLKKLVVGVGIFLLAAGSGKVKAAGLRRHDIKAELMCQQRKIHEGLACGALNRRQARKLEFEQQQIRRDIRLAKADGFMSRDEMRFIRQEQARADRDIFRMERRASLR